VKGSIEDLDHTNPYFLLTERKDRLGSCWLPAVVGLMYASTVEKTSVYTRALKYQGSIFFKPILESAVPVNTLNKKDIAQGFQPPSRLPGGIRQSLAACCSLHECDNISHFRRNHKDYFLDIIRQGADARGYRLPWADSANVIAVHLRLGDVGRYRDYDGTSTHKYISNLIDTGHNNSLLGLEGYDRKVSGIPSPVQRPIDINKLNSLLENILIDNPYHEVHVITTSDVADQLKSLTVPFTAHTQGSEDYDLWLLMNSDILIMGKSTFPIVSGFLHLGSRVVYPKWDLVAANGLLSKYDQTQTWYAYA
jgi:hypothetical protein